MNDYIESGIDPNFVFQSFWICFGWKDAKVISFHCPLVTCKSRFVISALKSSGTRRITLFWFERILPHAGVSEATSAFPPHSTWFLRRENIFDIWSLENWLSLTGVGWGGKVSLEHLLNPFLFWRIKNIHLILLTVGFEKFEQLLNPRCLVFWNEIVAGKLKVSS